MSINISIFFCYHASRNTAACSGFDEVCALNSILTYLRKGVKSDLLFLRFANTYIHPPISRAEIYYHWGIDQRYITNTQTTRALVDKTA